MAPKGNSSNKAKIARRVVEVLEYFDDVHREATVMDLVRRFGRPQSSTSELLQSLVELGLLYKHPGERTYSLSARAALLGTGGQPDLLRDGVIVSLMDRLSMVSGLAVCLSGMVGLDAQIVSWRPAPADRYEYDKQPTSGRKETLFRLAAGRLMLSTIERQRCEGLVRRMNAEASYDLKFAYGEMIESIEKCRHEEASIGPAGFGLNAHAVNCLVPRQPQGQPLVVSLVYAEDDEYTDPAVLLTMIRSCIRECVPEPASVMELKHYSRAA